MFSTRYQITPDDPYQNSGDDSGYWSEKRSEKRSEKKSDAKKSRIWERLAIIPEEADERVVATPPASNSQKQAPRPETFFSRVQSAFDNPPKAKVDSQNRHVPVRVDNAFPGPKLPASGSTQMLSNIRSEYAQMAQKLHQETFTELETAHKQLVNTVKEEGNQGQNALEGMEKLAKNLALPFSSFDIDTKTKNPDGSITTERRGVDKVVDEARKAMNDLEGQLDDLWGQQEKAQKEVYDAMQDLLQGLHNDMDKDEDMEGAYDTQDQAFVQEASDLVKNAMNEVKKIEEDHRRATAPHFQAILDVQSL